MNSCQSGLNQSMPFAFAAQPKPEVIIIKNKSGKQTKIGIASSSSSCTDISFM